MKNIITLITLFSFLLIGNYSIQAQSDSLEDTTSIEQVESMESSEAYSTNVETVTESASFHQIIKQKFIEANIFIPWVELVQSTRLRDNG